MKKIENCIPNKETIATLCYEKLKGLLWKFRWKKSFWQQNALENCKAFTIEQMKCQRKDKFEWKLWIVQAEKGAAKVFKNLLGNIVNNLNICQYSHFDPITENVKDPTLKAILK